MPETYGLKIGSDRVVTPHGVGAYDVYTQGDRIAAVCERGTVDLPVEREIDATGMVVVRTTDDRRRTTDHGQLTTDN